MYIPSISYWFNATGQTGEQFLKENGDSEAYAGVVAELFDPRCLLGFNDGDTFWKYHTHPKAAARYHKGIMYKCLSRNPEVLDILKKLDVGFEKFAETAICANCSVPTKQDILGSMVLYDYFIDENINFVEAVASPYGILSYSISTSDVDGLIKKINKLSSPDSEFSFDLKKFDVTDVACILKQKIQDLNEQYKDQIYFEFHPIKWH